MTTYDDLLDTPAKSSSQYDDLLMQQATDIASAGPPAQAAAPPAGRFAPIENPSVGGFIGNMKESGQANVSNMMGAIKDPGQAISAIMALMTDPSAREGFMKYVTESYGSFDKFKRAAYNDPVGVASELSVVGLPIKGAGTAMKVPAMARAGMAIEHLDPSMALSTGAKAATANVAGKVADPQSTYENVLKMSVSPTSKYSQPRVRDRVTKRLLDDQVEISPQGVADYQAKISSMTRQLDGKIAAADRAGTTIPLADIIKDLKPLVDQVTNPITNPSSRAEAKAVYTYINNWLSSMGPVTELKPSQVRELRQTLDKQIGWGKVDTTTPPIQKRTQEALANAARGRLATSLDTEGVTAKDIGGALEALTPLERSSARMRNNNAIGLREAGTMAAGFAAGSLGDDMLEKAAPMILSGAAAYLMNMDTKQKIARAIWRNKTLDDAAKRTWIRQLIDTSAEGMAGGQQMQEPQGGR
jgi:hypothetical protein